MAPAVSVIIPTHDRIDLLREALDSVAAQTFSDVETIVVDDGSSEDIARGVCDHAARPRVIRQSQGGPGSARNRGIREAVAPWVAFLDSDDLWLPEKLARFMAAAAARPEIVIWYGPMNPVSADRRPVPGRTKPCVGGRLTNALFAGSFVHVPTVVCRRQALLAQGGFNASLPVCEDYDLWLRMSVGHEFGLVEEPLALRRLHGDRLSKSCMRRNLAVKLAVLERHFEELSRMAGFDVDAARARLARTAFAAGRAAWRQAHFSAAAAYFRTARRHGAGVMRVWPMQLTAAALRGVIDRTSRDEQTPVFTERRAGSLSTE